MRSQESKWINSESCNPGGHWTCTGMLENPWRKKFSWKYLLSKNFKLNKTVKETFQAKKSAKEKNLVEKIREGKTFKLKNPWK